MRVLIEGPAEQVQAAAAALADGARTRWGLRCEVLERPAGEPGTRGDLGAFLTVVLALPGWILAVDTLAAKLKRKAREAEAEDLRRALEARYPETRVTFVPGEGQRVEFLDDED